MIFMEALLKTTQTRDRSPLNYAIDPISDDVPFHHLSAAP